MLACSWLKHDVCDFVTPKPLETILCTERSQLLGTWRSSIPTLGHPLLYDPVPFGSAYGLTKPLGTTNIHVWLAGQEGRTYRNCSASGDKLWSRQKRNHWWSQCYDFSLESLLWCGSVCSLHPMTSRGCSPPIERVPGHRHGSRRSVNGRGGPLDLWWSQRSANGRG